MKKSLLLQMLGVAILSALVTMLCGFLFALWRNDTLIRWEIGLAAAAMIIAFCFWMAWFGAKKFCDFIDQLNRQLEENGENAQLSDPDDIPYSELKRLQNNIKTLAHKVRNSRQKLENRQSQFDFILDNMREGFLIADLDRRIIYLNKKASNVLGIPPNSLRNRISDVISDQDILEAVDKAVSQNMVSNFDLSMLDGSIYLLTAQIIRPENARHKGQIILALSDVTAERSALRQRQDFFSNASHELKTPITSIRGFAELLESGIVTDSEKAQESVRIIHREAERMTRIVDDLLLIAKLENDKIEEQYVSIQIRELIEEIRDSLAPIIHSRHISVEISGGEFSVYAVYLHMHNLFANLIQNAVKYNIDSGSVWVRVETDGRNLFLTVKDTGIGIPADLRSRVFERFFRVDKGRSRSVGGTGLGLAIVKHIVSLYNGNIQLDSTFGEGTTITARIPLPEQET